MTGRPTSTSAVRPYADFAVLGIASSGYLLMLSADSRLLQGHIDLVRLLAFVSISTGLLYLWWRRKHHASASAHSQPDTHPLLSVAHSFGTAIKHSNNEQELFRKICTAAVQLDGIQAAWIGMLKEGRLKPVAWQGIPAHYLDNLQTSPDAAANAALQNNQPFWTQDMQHDPATLAWQKQGALHNWKSAAALPLPKDGAMAGTLVLYADTPEAFDTNTRLLLDGVAHDIGAALGRFEHDAQYALLAEELLHSEQRFLCLVEQSLAGIYILQDGKFSYANSHCAEIFGYGSAEHLLGHDPLQFTAEEDRNKLAEHLAQLMERKTQSVALEFTIIRRDGMVLVAGTNATVANYQGKPAIIGLIQDISEKKRAAEQIASYVAKLRSGFLGTVKLATSLGELRDPYTAGHERRVSEIAVAIATQMGLDEQRIEGIKVAAYLHDIGKIGIPAEFLVKPTRLTAAEYVVVQGHAQASYDTLKHVEFPWPVATIAHQHHERMDGNGYPNRLKGEEILLEARIIAVADVVEAMASHRPYRPGLGLEKALEEVERGSGNSFDPEVAKACLALFRDHGYQLPSFTQPAELFSIKSAV